MITDDMSKKTWREWQEFAYESTDQPAGRSGQRSTHNLSMPTMQTTIEALLAPGKGILAADESLPTIAKRFKSVHIESTEKSRHAYREMLFSTPGLNEFISGAILFDETIRQATTDGVPMAEALARLGIVPGIKVDKGTIPFTRFSDEMFTQGLDGLSDRLIEYRSLGARFTKWRAVIACRMSVPSRACVEANAQALALFASLSQAAGLVPIVEPEVMMNGCHSIERSEEVAVSALTCVFDALRDHRVSLEHLILKTGMVLSGAGHGGRDDEEAVAAATRRCLLHTVPASVPGIVFLSGGQDPETSTRRLHAICQAGTMPWRLSFSFGRALQTPVLAVWGSAHEKARLAQDVLLHRAACNGAAVRGRHFSGMEGATATHPQVVGMPSVDMAPTSERRKTDDLDQQSISTIRFLAVDAVEKARSGHPGLPMGAAPMAYVLWSRHLRHDPSDPHWFNRDRFVLSAGHGSMLLYALLHLTGYDLPLEELRNFRQWGSRTPGHPERGVTPGVEATTGPLGQGFANGVGMAIAEAHLAARYNRPGFEIIDHCTYGLVSDGDLMEGIASEAASLAGHLKLGKLIYLYDDNRITLATSTQVTFTEDHAQRFASYGWQVLAVDDGNDVEAIDRAIHLAREDTERPSLIIVRTHIGFGAPHKQDTCAAHGAPLGEEEVRLAKERLGWPIEPTFLVPPQVEAHCHLAVARGHLANAEWTASLDGYGTPHAQLARELRMLIRGQAPPGWDADVPHFPADDEGMATRVASEIVLNAFVGRLPGLIGGSADLTPSTGTEMKGSGNFEHPSMAIGDLQGASSGGWSYAGSNLQFGVREHAMGGILNGLALHGGTTPFGATFLTFSDYLRPSIRLAALMRVPVIYVFTHDSIAMGEDGPTHQPVEQLASLRAIPGLTVIRPGDANEAAMAWRLAIEARDGPVALILTRQPVPTLDRQIFASEDGVRRGAYVLSDDPGGRAILILLASGSEVGLMVSAGKVLRKNGVAVRLVSMPSWELFEAQSAEYRQSVLPPHIVNRLAIEAGIAQGWHRYVGSRGEVLGIERFGASAPGPVLMREFGFTVDNICERAMRLIGDGTCLIS